MTGFGIGTVPLGSGRVTLEVRSLNHRFLELRVRIPSELSEHTFYLEQLCRTQLKRGRYDVSVRIDGGVRPAATVDLAKARAAFQALEQLRDEFAPGAEVPLAALTAIPDLFVSPIDSDPAPAKASLDQSLAEALSQLNTMRLIEGAALNKDMSARLGRCRELTLHLEADLPRLIATHEARLQQRLSRLSETLADVDERRLAMEVALLAERSDIAEELARLKSHFDQFQDFLDASEPVGRKLDFLLQEMAREANTISAKCQDAELSSSVIALKAELERLREQVQNVE